MSSWATSFTPRVMRFHPLSCISLPQRRSGQEMLVFLSASLAQQGVKADGGGRFCDGDRGRCVHRPVLVSSTPQLHTMCDDDGKGCYRVAAIPNAKRGPSAEIRDAAWGERSYLKSLFEHILDGNCTRPNGRRKIVVDHRLCALGDSPRRARSAEVANGCVAALGAARSAHAKQPQPPRLVDELGLGGQVAAEHGVVGLRQVRELANAAAPAHVVLRKFQRARVAQTQLDGADERKQSHREEEEQQAARVCALALVTRAMALLVLVEQPLRAAPWAAAGRRRHSLRLENWQRVNVNDLVFESPGGMVGRHHKDPLRLLSWAYGRGESTVGERASREKGEACLAHRANTPEHRTPETGHRCRPRFAPNRRAM